MEKRYKILVVDDDPKQTLLMKTMLKPHGYDVVQINDSRQAIKTAREEKPDLIFLDIMMPGLDGYTVLDKIKNEQTMKNIPVVMVSAVGLDGNKEFASVLGATTYITKPIDSKHLLETIAHFLPDSTS